MVSELAALLSLVVGALNVQAEPHCTVLLLAHVSGGVEQPLVTVVNQVEVLFDGSASFSELRICEKLLMARPTGVVIMTWPEKVICPLAWPTRFGRSQKMVFPAKCA